MRGYGCNTKETEVWQLPLVTHNWREERPPRGQEAAICSKQHGNMPVLSFFVARVSVEGNKKKATLYLRHSYTDTSQDFTASEGSLTAFCFPLGVESVTPKEFLASEVRKRVVPPNMTHADIWL